MRAFDKVLTLIVGAKENGHAIRCNQQNIESRKTLKELKSLQGINHG